MQNCLLYGRLSKGDASLESHEARCVKYAEFQEFRIIHKYEDEDTSGGINIKDRIGGRALFIRLRFGDIQHVVVAKLDRLGRRARDILETLESFEKAKVTLHIVDFGGSAVTTQGHMGKFILTIFAGVAEWELSEIKDRVQKRMDHKFAKGELTGKVPYGYDVVYRFSDGTTLTSAKALNAADLASAPDSDGGLVASPHAPRTVVTKLLIDNPREQALLRHMSVWRASGWTFQRIAAWLNENGIPSKLGGRWQSGNVAGVLESRHTRRLLETPVVPSSGNAQLAA